MKRSCTVLLVLVALGVTPLRAAPPTVVPSPGYDARLQEQRAAAARQSAAPVSRPIAPRHHKRARAR